MRRTALVLVAFALAAGCARAPRAAAPIVYKAATPETLLALYNANADKITTLAAELQMVIYYEADHATRQYRVAAWLDAQKPGRLRLRHDALGTDLFFIVSNGQRFWIGLDRSLAGGKDVVYTGTFGALTRESVFRPDRLLSAFSLSPLPPASASETLFEAYADRYVLVFVEGGESRRIAAKAIFGRTDLRLSSYQVFDGQSRLALQVDFKKYRTVNDVDMPESLFISWPLDHFAILATVTKATIGAALPPRIWEFKWRSDAEVIDLDAREAQEPPEPASSQPPQAQ
jgi:outer membrane lipoprotein-sorting protein